MMPEARRHQKSRRALAKIRDQQVDTIPDELADQVCALQQKLARLEGERLYEPKKGRPERSIAQTIVIVSQWRTLYEGIEIERPDGTKVLKEYTLKQAAQLLKINKKSLDSYLLYLRYGRRLKFDFETHINKGYGYLRGFVNAKKRAELDKKKASCRKVQKLDKSSL